MENHQDNFWQFSDQLRLQGSNFSNLSLNDTIWGSSFGTTQKRVEERKNFDIRVGGERSSVEKQSIGGFGTGEVNGFNNGWKIENSFGGLVGGSQHKNINNINGVFNKGVYSKSGAGFNGGLNKININNNNNNNISNFSNNGKFEQEGKIGGKKYSNNNSNNSSGNNGQNKNSVDKRFKTLPPSESLPRSEPVGGYIFVCNNDTMQENLKRQLFGLPPRYRDSVRQITPGLPLFLYNYSTHQLHGIFEASGFGGSNIDATAWEDKKCPGESRFPAQVKVVTRKVCEPLEEDAFRPILHHYDGPKFRLELSVPEALSLLDVFVDNALSDVFVENNS